MRLFASVPVIGGLHVGFISEQVLVRPGPTPLLFRLFMMLVAAFFLVLACLSAGALYFILPEIFRQIVQLTTS